MKFRLRSNVFETAVMMNVSSEVLNFKPADEEADLEAVASPFVKGEEGGEGLTAGFAQKCYRWPLTLVLSPMRGEEGRRRATLIENQDSAYSLRFH